jgi:diguanylate cyclase (GGDEF)-like protein
MLRQRVLSQLAAGAMVAILIFSGLYVFITQSYQRLERQTLELDRQRVLNALDMQIERIDEVIDGWAQSGFIEYSAATPGMTVYRDFGVDNISGSFDIAEVVLFKSDGQFLVGRATDPTLELSDSPLDEMSPFVAAVQSLRLFEHHAESPGKSGLALLHGKPHLISAHQNTDYFSVKGTSSIVAASHLDDRLLGVLEEAVKQELDLYALSEFSSSGENLEIVSRMRKSGTDSIIVPVNNNEVHTYTLLNDFSGVPAFVLRATADREFFAQASRTLLWFGLSAGLAFIALVTWFLIILDRSVLRRLHGLNQSIIGLQESGKLDALMPGGTDEIGQVGTAFNRLLESLGKSQEDLSYQANHDSLTGLINRREFERELGAAIEKSKADGVERHLLFLDLDLFKIVNDSCGHLAGDAVLQELASLMKEQLGEADIFARIGGDEFGIILPGRDSSAARLVSENIREVVARFRYLYGGRQFMFGVSAGLLDLSSTAVDSREEAMTLADSACRIAKSSGRNRTHEHHVDDERLGQQLLETQWVSRVTDALERDLFVLYFQRIVGQQEGVVGAELLIRMQDEDGGIIAPGLFIPSAERYRLMGQIDRWVIDHFLHWYRTNETARSEFEFFTINLSGQSLADADFLDYLRARVRDSGVPGSKLFFEITETSIIDNLSIGREFINGMKALGCRFALDDFGAGMSSFVYLRDLPVDMVKIEGTFCQNMISSEVDRAMVKSIVEISKLMDLVVVAECIENEAIADLCTAMGVDYLQGYWLHRPEALTKP